ncbi:tetratricopeptide repeat protein [Campylobacter portucalensis]|uniref:tetratricopeptide repeat protein n=1 Tax=Campylobacter portucalensis TaxID=2608384 RepID=UPI0012B1C43B|nr:tetratricopeptide repeat protein [Campylobacter portucalensis]
MRKILLLIIFLNLSFAKIFDFYYENKANSAYFDGDFKKAAKSYAKIDSQKAKYNEGVSLYRDGNYTGAIEKFKEVEAEELKFEKLYNLGNSYAKLEEIDKAIENYEKALKIKNDEDAKFNLELLKKQKNKKEQKNDKKEQKNDTKDNENSKDDKNMNQKNQDSKDSNSDNQKKNEEEKDQNHQPNKHKTQSDDENLNNQKSDNNGSKQKEQNFKYDKEKAINELEQKRWQNILQKRDIGTFIVPLKNSKEKNENLKPW